MSATVVALHVTPSSRAALVPSPRATMLEDRGVEGDRRRARHRQVLLMEAEELETLGLAPGAVREQVTVRGLKLASLGTGARIGIGDAIFEVGEPCAPCERMEEIRSGLRAALEGRRGRFVRVVRPGTVAVGDEVTLL
jgi:MOSC domain-containing protein YiiM